MKTINFSNCQTQASNLFMNGHRCSEAILKTYGPKFGLDENLCMKIGCALGGGIGSTRNICGAVSAAVIVLGLAFGRSNHDDQLNKDKTNRVTKHFIDKFISKYHHLNCNELKKTDEDICACLVQDATKILEEVILIEKGLHFPNNVVQDS